MKTFCFLFLIATTSSCCFGQTLTQGTFSSITLFNDVRSGHPVPNCYYYEYNFHSNCLPFVTGVDLYLRFDSIVGTTDSIQIWRNPDYMFAYIKSGDSIIINSTNLILIYFLGNDTLYSSLIASGTPQISGETYFCNYTKELGLWVDGCNNLVSRIWGGNSPMDTIKGCSVLTATGIDNTKSDYFKIFPNPFNESIILETYDQFLEVSILDLLGNLKYHSFIDESNIKLDLQNLTNGVYILIAKTASNTMHRKLVKSSNSQ